jgi:hypothetical protein
LSNANSSRAATLIISRLTGPVTAPKRSDSYSKVGKYAPHAQKTPT